ncbi:hypothetical protein WR25_25637 [Diploscapter pachys]|uniref:ZP domain-containing protein n=1 Tax=Diploscapter pachys TaxID=2018661 RepID=A0A2A2KKS1_9BILA|nr:hypothetical protein WR25_25637 [Diploscapter pachys]
MITIINEIFRTTVLLIVLLPIQVYSIYQSFYPDVRWSCSQTEASIFVRTQYPFDGLITPTGISNPDCQTKGVGTNVAVLKLPLDRNDKCGLKFDEDLGIFSTSIDIRQHGILILEDDKTINISCRAPESKNETMKSREDLQFELRILSNGISTRNVRYSLPYTLQIRPKVGTKLFSDRPFDTYQVGVCTAKSLKSNITVQLTDSFGCALYESIMGDFENRGNTSEATIPTMFRFPDADSIAFSCAITDCEGVCGARKCRAPRESAEEILDRTTVSLDLEEHNFYVATIVVSNDNQAEKKESTTKNSIRSTTSPLSSESSTMLYPSPQCVQQSDMDLLYGICIFLSICSTIGFCMNILLCCLLRKKHHKDKSQKCLKYSPNHYKKNKLPSSLGQACPQDFWIIEPKVDQPYFERRSSAGCPAGAYASVKKPHIRPHLTSTINFSEPQMPYRSSIVSSEGASDIYSRNDIGVTSRNHGEMRHSSSTFLTSVETDSNISSTSNQILNPTTISNYQTTQPIPQSSSYL